MKTAHCRVFPPKKSSLLQTMPGQPNGAVMNVAVDVGGACRFMTELGPDQLIGVTLAGPAVQVWYWLETPDPASNDPADAGEEVELG